MSGRSICWRERERGTLPFRRPDGIFFFKKIAQNVRHSLHSVRRLFCVKKERGSARPGTDCDTPKFLPLYRVTMETRNCILLILFWKFFNLVQLLCHFCPILTSPSKIGQTVEQPKRSQQNLVPDHHGLVTLYLGVEDSQNICRRAPHFVYALVIQYSFLGITHRISDRRRRSRQILLDTAQRSQFNIINRNCWMFCRSENKMIDHAQCSNLGWRFFHQKLRRATPISVVCGPIWQIIRWIFGLGLSQKCTKFLTNWSTVT